MIFRFATFTSFLFLAFAATIGAAETRPNILLLMADDLYDHDSDPREYTNLATDARYAGQLQKLRAVLAAELPSALPNTP